MQGVTQEFLDTVRGPHSVRARVDVIRDDRFIQSVEAVVDGAVEMDRSAKYQRRFNAVIADPTASPREMRDLFAPFGTEVRVYRGAVVPVTEEILDVDTTPAQWGQGTLTNTLAHSSGDLILD